MTTLPAPDLTKLRTGQQSALLYLSVFKPTTLLTALINEPSATPGQREIDYAAGSGGESRQGYENLSLLWNSLSASQAATLRRIIVAAEVIGGQGNGTLYLTLPRANAGAGWIDVSGVALMPEWSPEGGEAQGYGNVLLRLNAVVVEADPSTVG